MKYVALLLAVLALAISAPAFAADGAFTDVPSEHWAYDAVNSLQAAGLVQGYPDGTFQGKRTLSRYEFAMVIARLLPLIGNGPVVTTPGQPPVQPGKVDLSGYATKGDIAGFAKQSDVDNLRRLVNEFKDELAALGVDVKNIKDQIASLDARLTAVEIEQRRVKWTGDVMLAGTMGANQGDVPVVDADNRAFTGMENPIRSAGFVRDFDLNIVGKVSDDTTANATINYGNYLNYLGVVDAYAGVSPALASTATDTFFPYFLYVQTGTKYGNLTIGRFPLQLTPYTFKMIDVDSYLDNKKLDCGNYPVDGVKLASTLFGVDWTLFAVKNDANIFTNGLSSQAVIAFNDLGGINAGGLTSGITQSAGAHAAFGMPWNGKLGLTYVQAWSANGWLVSGYDKVQVMGATLKIPVFNTITLDASANKTITNGNNVAKKIDESNGAYDYKLSGKIGGFGVGVGYKRIGDNYTAPGSWDKIGRWANPSMIKGMYGDVSYNVTNNISLGVNGEALKYTDTKLFATKDDEINKIAGDLSWKLGGKDSVLFNYEKVTYGLKGNSDLGLGDPKETYITLGWARKLGANANLKASYQLISYQSDGPYNPYGSGYRGGLGVVQLGVSF